VTEFHLLRPWWLLALPFAALLVWAWWRSAPAATAWRAVVDPWLLPHLLNQDEKTHRSRPFVLILSGLMLAILALAGPSWNKIELPLYRTLAARVIVLDLSLSMRAADYQPSRLQLARAKVAEILRRSDEHETGLVVFAGAGFVVAPLTYDAGTLSSFVQVLDTGLMPLQGSRPDRGLEKAVELLQQAGAGNGELLLICDGFRGNRVIELAADLYQEGHRISVLAAGSGAQPPIPLASGDFLLGLNGRIVQAYTDLNALRAVASAGGGNFAQMTADDSDLDQLLGNNGMVSAAQLRTLDNTVERWREQGPWLLLLLLPLAALAFRRGWLLGLILLCSMPFPSAPVSAADWNWNAWWLRPDQQAARELAAGEPVQMLENSPDPAWRGSALYRSGDFAGAAKAFAELDSADGHYNRGNALAKAQQLEAAITAYDQALVLEPAHFDALHNKLLVEALLRQQQQQQQRSDEPAQSADDESSAQTGSARQNDGSGEDSGENRSSRQSEEPDTGQPDTGQVHQIIASDVPGDGGDSESAAATPARGPLPPLQQWLEQIEDDPGEALRRKFEQQYRRSRYGDTRRSDAW
jgi:Ca-activated chloride channel family protein